jgi:cytochrome P450
MLPQMRSNPIRVFLAARFTVDRVAARPRFAYLPFGGGPRQCIGNQFAMVEATLILAIIAQRYQVQLTPGQHIAADPLITLRPKRGIRVRLAARDPAQRNVV